MKKIVGIAAAAAMLASSVFAADVAAKVNLGGSLFNYSANTKKVQALAIDEGGQGWNPSFQMSISGDQAGASMKFYDLGATDAVKNVNYNIWFKPFNVLTVNVGNWSTNLNQESITYSGTKSGIDSNGIALSLAVEGFSADVFFAPGWSPANFGWNVWEDGSGTCTSWFEKADGSNAVVADTYFKLQYAADFGTINGMLYAKSTFKDLTFGAGYKNTFSGVNAFVNVLGYYNNDKFQKVRVEAFASGSVDAFGWALWVPVDIPTVENSQVSVGAIAKLTYAIDGVTPYIQISDGNFNTSAFAMEVKVGCTGNLGAMSWDAAIDAYIQEKFKIDVPLTLSVSF